MIAGVEGAAPTDAADRLGGDIDGALEGIGLVAWITDGDGVIRWANARARDTFGGVVGRRVLDFVAPESLPTARSHLVRHMVGQEANASFKATVCTAAGERLPVEVHSVALTGGERVVGIFGVASPGEGQPAVPHDVLTPRQLQILALLADGASTEQLASDLHLSINTVRNHIRGVLRALGVHSRLEAVVEGRRRGLV